LARKSRALKEPEVRDDAQPTITGMGPEPERSESGFTSRNTDDGKASKKRLGFAITEEGKIDWDSVRKKDELKENLRVAIVGDPEMIRALGLGSAQAGEISEENVRAIIDQFGHINRFISGYVIKVMTKGKSTSIDPDIAEAAFTFTKEQKDELAPRGARVANAYSTEWMKKYQDLIAFFGMLAMYSSNQIQQAVMTQVLRDTLKGDAEAQRAPRVHGHGTLPGEDRVAQ
jgi:hypothetical protein